MENSNILPVTTYGHEILRTVCVETENDEITKAAIKNLLETLKCFNSGVGLAAPQINLNSRMFVIKSGREFKVMINPVIKKKRGEVLLSPEGCLSIPGIFNTIPGRSEIIDLEFYDENFNKKRMKFGGFESIIIQHEFDHLNGVLYIDYLTKEGREKIADKLSDIEKGNFICNHPMIIKTGEIIIQKEQRTDDVLLSNVYLDAARGII